MPIYEFICPECRILFNFFSRSINTEKTPACPACKKDKILQRQISRFAVTGRAVEKSTDDFPVDENKMERAMEALAGEAENIREDNPKQMAGLMRKFTDMTGMHLGENMETALQRLEKGDDPEKIEAEMGDILEKEDPFQMNDTKGSNKKRPIKKDETLYDM